MPAEVAVIAYSVAAPAAAAVAVAWLLQLLLPAAAAGRYALSVALAAGFFAGYWLLPDWAPLVPARHWHWLPYLAAAAAIAGPISLASGVTTGERWLVYLLLAAAVAWRIVPLWPHLWPPRLYAVPLVAAYLWLLMVLLTALPDRLLGRTFTALLAAAAIASAIVITLPASAKLGLVALVAGATMSGCTVATVLHRRLRASREANISRSEMATMATAVRGMLPVFAVLVGSLACAGSVEVHSPHPSPHPAMFFAPAAPLLLWLFAAGPLARLQGLPALAAQSAVVLLPMFVALAWVALLNNDADEWGQIRGRESLAAVRIAQIDNLFPPKTPDPWA